MENKSSVFGLAINNDVVAQMAGMAALEVVGVAGLAKRPIELKTAFKSGGYLRSVKVAVENGVVNIDVYIKVTEDANVKSVAETVQLNVKEKIQSMTGSAVTKVNVIIADVEFSGNELIPEEIEA